LRWQAASRSGGPGTGHCTRGEITGASERAPGNPSRGRHAVGAGASFVLLHSGAPGARFLNQNSGPSRHQGSHCLGPASCHDADATLHQARWTPGTSPPRTLTASSTLCRSDTRLVSMERPVGFQNSATVLDQAFYAARSYSLMRPPRTGWRLIRFWKRSAGGWSGRGG
jgi:hypothetical protein